MLLSIYTKPEEKSDVFSRFIFWKIKIRLQRLTGERQFDFCFIGKQFYHGRHGNHG